MTSIALTADFVTPAFHGLRDDGEPDWPPSPLRLAGALMSGCHHDLPDAEARAALAALVALPQPEVWVPDHVRADLPATYAPRSGAPTSGAVTGKKLAKWADESLVGLASTARVAKPVGGVYLAGRRVVYLVDDPRQTVDVAALDRAARRVPYFGRSHNVCDVSAAHESPDTAADDEALSRWVPEPDRRGSTRGWSPASLPWMDANHEITVSGSPRPRLPAGPYSVAMRYVRPRRVPSIPSPGSAIRVLPLRRSQPAGAVRGLMSSLKVPSGTTLFPCVFTEGEYADGRVLGVAVLSALSTTPSAPDPVPLLAAESSLRAAHPDLFAEPGGSSAAVSLSPNFWGRSSRVWRSATPLRAFPDIRVVDRILVDELQRITGRSVQLLRADKAPRLPGEQRWRQPGDGLDQWWVSLMFDTEVAGPLQAGATQDEGFGLFVPDSSRSQHMELT